MISGNTINHKNNMAGLKSLVKDTALYGLSSMVGRFLNYLLVPLYTAVLPAASGGYGVVTNVYAWAGLIMVLLTFCQLVGRRSGESICQFTDFGRGHFTDICHSLPDVSPTGLSSIGIWRSSRFHRNDDYSDGTRCFSVHSVCLSAFQEAAH